MTSESIKVSVIVPVYNAESTISKCLDSLVNQTLSGWEVILVDDGSTDMSGMICDEYKKKCAALSNGDIYVIHRENGGVSAARQTGLDAAKGDYVIHVDPDDWAELTMLQDLYELAKTEDADMVICDFVCEINGNLYYKKQAPTSLHHEDVLNDMFGKIHGSCCNKLVRRKCILQYDANFPIGINYCEDVCFNVQLLKNDIKIIYYPKAYYHYIQTSVSITNNYTRKTYENHLGFVDYLATLLPIDSLPVRKSKLLVKKLAFRNSILKREEFVKLFPDIVATDDENLFLKWMYDCAFRRWFTLADSLLFVYKTLHN